MAQHVREKIQQSFAHLKPNSRTRLKSFLSQVVTEVKGL
jgi:hypothetical protein